ncbi:MAG: hypothetical protein QOI42_995 [Frankiaceae bacterium]|nr:hypothetical protein [Frankiaceae bacterium]
MADDILETRASGRNGRSTLIGGSVGLCLVVALVVHHTDRASGTSDSGGPTPALPTASQVAAATTVPATSGSTPPVPATGPELHLTRFGDAPPRSADEARQRGRSLLSRAVLPAGSLRLSRLVPALDQAGSTIGSKNLVSVSELWSVPLPVGAVGAWMRQHPPASLAETASATGSAGPSGPFTEELRFGPYDDGLDFTLTKLDATTAAVRVTAQVVWIAPRAADEMLRDVSSVKIQLRSLFDSGPVYGQVTVTGRKARRLAAAYNSLEYDVRGVHGCLALVTKTVLVFNSASGSAESAVLCGGASLVRPGHAEVQLGTTQDLEAEIAADLGPVATPSH